MQKGAANILPRISQEFEETSTGGGMTVLFTQTTLPIYLDNQAATPLDPRVLDAMRPYLEGNFGNPSSRHHIFGQMAHEAVEQARRHIANTINAEEDEIIFTSGATESNNIAIRGVLESYREKGRHLVTLATEHKSLLVPANQLAKEGFDVTVLSVSSDGLLDMRELEQALKPETVLVSIMTANNEIGVIQPIEQIGALCRKREILFHTDATQGIGKIPIDVKKQNIDLLSLSAHKIYGPKGIGALYIRRRKPRVKLNALLLGGDQERGMRAGTLNTPAIVGLGAAIQFAIHELPMESKRLAKLRDQLLAELNRRIQGIRVNGSLGQRLPGNLNVSIQGVDSEALLFSLKRIAISSGSACTSLSVEPSHVLTALGLDREDALSSIRISIGRFNTEEDIEIAIEEISQQVDKIRSLRGWSKEAGITKMSIVNQSHAG